MKIAVTVHRAMPGAPLAFLNDYVLLDACRFMGGLFLNAYVSQNNSLALLGTRRCEDCSHRAHGHASCPTRGAFYQSNCILLIVVIRFSSPSLAFSQ